MKVTEFRIGLLLIDDATGKNYATSLSKEENEKLQIIARGFKTISTSKKLELVLKDKEVLKLLNKGESNESKNL